MKKLLFAFLLLTTTMGSTVYAQTFTIPDANLANWMRNNGYAFAMTGNVLDTVLLEQYVISNGPIGSSAHVGLSNQNISSLDGIRFVLRTWDTYTPSVDLSHNQLTEIPWQEFATTGKYLSLDFSWNQLDTVIYGPIEVEIDYLILSNNGMRHFDIQTFDGSIFVYNTLDLSFNQLPDLPVINGFSFTPQPLANFNVNVANNMLTKQPTGNYSWLNCEENQIDSITNDLINNPLFWMLNCNHNNITYFNLTEPFSGNLARIYCTNNPMTHIDGLPTLCAYISCDTTQINTWPDFRNTDFLAFECNGCNLTETGFIPDQMSIVRCYNNPNLSCISNLPNNTYFEYDFSNTLVACVPYKVPGCNYVGYPDMATIPECSVSNPNGCIAPPQITGTIYHDANSNCIFDGNETTAYGQKVSLMANGNIVQQYITRVNGFYYFGGLSNGNYQVVADTNQLLDVTCPINATHTVTVGTQANNGINFGAECPQSLDVSVASIAIVGGLRPGVLSQCHVVIEGMGLGGACLAGVSGQLTVTLPQLYTYQSTLANALAPTTTTANTLTWDINDLGTIDLRNDFRFWSRVSNTATANDTICIMANIIINGTDVDLSNNQLQTCLPARAAYDPNNKLVDPAGDIEPVQEWLTYTVNFQNTGNAPALDVYVLDTLPAELDPYSIQVIASSHDHSTQVFQNGIVKFDLPNINLIDSLTNEPESHGYVRFKVKVKPNLPIGTTINNRVGIYFDFNPVVMTDYATNTIAIPLPNIAINPSAVCTLGDTSILVASEFSPNYTYEWLRNGSTFNATNDTLIVTDTASYTLKVSYSGDFATTNPYQVALYPLTPVSLTPASNNVCAGASALALTLDPVGGQLSGPGLLGNDFDPTLAGLGSHTLTYEYTDANGCDNEATTTISVNANPTVSLSAASNTVCENGSTIALTPSPAGGTYTGATLSGNTFDPADNTTGLNTINYSFTDANGCSGSANTDITVNANPVVEFNQPFTPFCKGSQPVDLTANAVPAGGIFSGTGIVGTSLDVSNTGTYAVEYTFTDGNGCSTTKQADLLVDECIGIANVDVSDMMVYPNPASSQLVVKASSGLVGNYILLLDVSGKVVLDLQATNNETIIPMANLANGWYMLMVQHQQGAVLYRTKVGVAR